MCGVTTDNHAELLLVIDFVISSCFMHNLCICVLVLCHGSYVLSANLIQSVCIVHPSSTKSSHLSIIITCIYTGV